MNESSKNKQCNTYHSLCQRHSFAERLGDVWQDIQSERHWKYEKLSPVQLLQKSELHRYPEDNDELARANWFWRRRPRFLQVTSCIVWLIAALGLPIWLFIVRHCSLDRSADSNNNAGDSRHRDCAICAVATSV
jgi:hypothetical protein